MYPLFLLSEVVAILAGIHTEKIKTKTAATIILILLGIITIWYALSELTA